MKTIYKLLLLLGFLSLCHAIWANDTIRFTWKGSIDSKDFNIKATKGKTFTINWGDGNSNTYTGQGTLETINPAHTYANTHEYTVTLTGNSVDCRFTNLACSNRQLSTLDVSEATALIALGCYFNSLSTLDLSKNTDLTHLLCYGNQLTALDLSQNIALTELTCPNNPLGTLDLSQNTALTYLWCSSNQLSTLDLSKNTALTTLLCYSNALPLADLYAASRKIINVGSKQLGPQYLPDQRVELNIPITLTADSILGGTNTAYTNIQKNGQPAVEEIDYTLTGSTIIFKTVGAYTVEFSNAMITSAADHPAKVVATFVTEGMRTNANLKILYIDKGTLTPAFAADTLNYTVNLPYEDSTITVIGVANYSLPTVTGNVIDTALAVGSNTFYITVTAEDSITTKTYTVNVIRDNETGIAEIPAKPVVSVYPNPANQTLFIQSEIAIQKVELYNMIGKMVLAEQNPQDNINIAGLANGTYLLKIYTNHAIVNRKIIVQR